MAKQEDFWFPLFRFFWIPNFGSEGHKDKTMFVFSPCPSQINPFLDFLLEKKFPGFEVYSFCRFCWNFKIFFPHCLPNPWGTKPTQPRILPLKKNSDSTNGLKIYPKGLEWKHRGTKNPRSVPVLGKTKKRKTKSFSKSESQTTPPNISPVNRSGFLSGDSEQGKRRKNSSLPWHGFHGKGKSHVPKML